MTLIFHEYLTPNDFLDPGLHPIFLSFHKYLYEELGNSGWNKSKKFSLKLASMLMLQNLNQRVVLNIYTNIAKKSYEVLYLNRLLIYLIENKYVTDITLKRLLYFKTRLTKQGKLNDVIMLLTDENFEEYIKFNPLNKSKTAELFFYTINSSLCKDPIIANFSNLYIDKLKLSSSTPASKLQLCQKFNLVFQEILIDLSVEDLTPSKLKGLIEKMPSNINSGSITQLSNFLIFLFENDVPLNDEIKSFLKLKDYLTVGVSKDTYLELLSCDEISKYVLLPANKKNQKGNYLAFINISCKEIYDIWLEYAIKTTYRDSGFMTICKEFDTSLGHIKLYSVNDLNFSTFCQQINYFKRYDNLNYLTPLISFYLHVFSNYNNQLFVSSGVDARLLQRGTISRELLEGYEFVFYNPIESVPTVDKWILCYSGMEDTNSSLNTTSTKSLDFTRIKCKVYRNWYKEYVWKNDSSLYTKTHMLSVIVYFFNYITDLKSGEQLSIYSKPTSNIIITTNEVLAYKNHILNTWENSRTRNSYIYDPRVVLNHVNNNDLATFENGVFHHLSHTLDTKYDNACAIPDSHLKLLSSLMKNNALNSLIHAIYYSIFYIGLETEFRSSQILSLTVDCVKEVAKKNQYVIVSKTKSSAGMLLEQPITIYVKKHIDEIIKLTENYRTNCSATDLKQYLFLVPGNKTGTYKILSRDDFNAYFKKCCQELKLPEYTLSNLRDTHMTKAEEFIIRNSMSEIEQKVLSGHKSSTTTSKHYIDTPLIELLESIHGITIGNVNIEGQILHNIPPEIATNENQVSNQCGYCQSSTCHNLTYLDCLLCKDFVTTLDRIPYFKEQLKVIDHKIKNASIQHDKEDLVNIKVLLLNYQTKLLELQEEISNE